jgi:two-component system, OmpR family, KDP operon response regulator KdpE
MAREDPTAAAEPTAATAPARILVIDDEPGIRSFATRALGLAGFTVAEAAGGHEGLKIALTDPADLVLLDLGLPDLDGEEVLRQLIQERPGQAVLVWSATADHDAERRCRSLGAHAYLHKPVFMGELLSCIAHECHLVQACG